MGRQVKSGRESAIGGGKQGTSSEIGTHRVKPGVSHATAGSENAVILEHEDVLVAKILGKLLLQGLLRDESFELIAAGLSAEFGRLREGREEPGLGVREPGYGLDVVVSNRCGALTASTVDPGVDDGPGSVHAEDVAMTPAWTISPLKLILRRDEAVISS